MKRQIKIKNETFEAFQKTIVALLHEEKAIAQKPFEPPDTVAFVKEPDRPPLKVDSEGMTPEGKKRLVERLSEIL